MSTEWDRWPEDATSLKVTQGPPGSASTSETFEQPGSSGPPFAKPAATRASAGRRGSITRLGANISTKSGFSDPAANAQLDQPGGTADPSSGSVPSAKAARTPVSAGVQKLVTQLSSKAPTSSKGTAENDTDSMENWQCMLADDSSLTSFMPQPRRPRSSVGMPDASTQSTAAAAKEPGSLAATLRSEANSHVGPPSAAIQRNAASAMARSKKITSSSGVPTDVAASRQAEHQQDPPAASASSDEKPVIGTDTATIQGSKPPTQQPLASNLQLSIPAVGGSLAFALADTPASMPSSTLPDSAVGLKPAHDKSRSISGSAPTALDRALPSMGSNNTAKSRSAQRYADLMANLGVAKPPNEPADQKAPSRLTEGRTASRRASLFGAPPASKSTAASEAALPSKSNAAADRTLTIPKAAAAGQKLASTADIETSPGSAKEAARSTAESVVKPLSTAPPSGSPAMAVPPAVARSAVASNRSLPKQVQLETLPSNSSSGSQAPARKTAAPPAQAQAKPLSSSQQTTSQQPPAAPSSRLPPFDKVAAAPSAQAAAAAKAVSASHAHAKSPSLTTHTKHVTAVTLPQSSLSAAAVSSDLKLTAPSAVPSPSFNVSQTADTADADDLDHVLAKEAQPETQQSQDLPQGHQEPSTVLGDAKSASTAHPAVQANSVQSASQSPSALAKATCVEAAPVSDRQAVSSQHAKPVHHDNSNASGQGAGANAEAAKQAFVPIPFGNSLANQPQISVMSFNDGSLDDDFDDLFFDSIGTGDASTNHITQVGDTKLLPTKAAAAGVLKPRQVPGTPSTTSAPAAAVAPSSAAPSLVAPDLAAPSSVASSAAPQKEVSSAAMSQELPSFHDWSQNTASPSSKSDATSGVAAAPAAPSDAGKQSQNAQPRLQNRSGQPDLADAKSVVNTAGLAQTASASAKLSAKEQSEPKLFNHQESTLPDDVADQQDKSLQSESQASDMTNAGNTADVSSQQQGSSPQQAMFSIPFSGQADSFAEGDDDVFGEGLSQQQPEPFSAAAPMQTPVGPEPSFSFDDFGEEQQQQQQQQWGAPISSDQARPQPQPQYLYASQDQGAFPSPYASQLLMQEHQAQQLSAANQASLQTGLPQPLWPHQTAQTHAHASTGFTPQKLSSSSTLRPANGELPLAPASLPAQQNLNFPAASSSLPFQQTAAPPSGLPFGQAAPPQQGHTPAPLPLQLPGGPLAVSTRRVPSPPPHDAAVSHAQQSPYSNEAAWNGQGYVAQSAPGPEDTQASTSQQYDPWAGQHVPSQGFAPSTADPYQSYTPPVEAPFPAAVAPAASAFPATMSSPFAQAAYNPDPWQPPQQVTTPSSALHQPAAAPVFPVASQLANPWAPGAAYPDASLWDQHAAAVSPWDTGATEANAAEAVAAGYSSQESGYRSTDGRPAVALMLFGFAGKMYCWRPTPVPGLAGAAGGFTGSSTGSLHILAWPAATADTPSQQPPQQQQQMSPCQQQEQQQVPALSASHRLMSQFPGPLMPNTPKDKVLSFVAEACQRCVEWEAHPGQAGDLMMLWKVLQLLCQHKGTLQSPVAPGTNANTPEAQLSAILLAEQSQSSAPVVTSSPASPWSNASAIFGAAGHGSGGNSLPSEVLQPQPAFDDLQQAAGQLQQLLMAGHRLEALRIAVEGKLWGPALLLARHCGDKAFFDTAAAMAKGSTTAGSPLHTLTLLMSGKADTVHAGHARPDAKSKANLANAADSAPLPASPFGLGAAMPTQDVLSQWQGNLAILASNKVAGNEAAMVQLGERLWRERSQAVAAHICFVLAGVHTQPCDPASQVCLVGADHRSLPRCFASTAAIQRSEVLEWARSQGNSSYTLQHGLLLLPYKLLYAARLAEHGLLSEAAQYCGAIQQALGALPKQPPALAVCRAFTQALLERLQTYAAAHNIPLQMSRSGSVLSISGVGRWLDRGLSRLMGSPDPPPPPQSGPGSTGSAHSDPDPYLATNRHRRNTSDQYLQSDTPKVTVPKRSQSSQDMLVLQQRQAKVAPSLASTPERAADAPTSQQQQQPKGSSGAVSRQPQKAASQGWMSRVKSGILGSAAKKSGPDKKASEAQIGEENKFYYDEELKQWRERGVEAPAPSGPPPPPPKMTPQRTASGSLTPGLTRQPSSGPASGSGKPPLPGGGPPSSGPPSSGGQPNAPRSSVRSRYVSNFSPAAPPGSGSNTAAVPLVPPRPFYVPRAAAQSAQLFQPSAPAVTSAETAATLPYGSTRSSAAPAASHSVANMTRLPDSHMLPSSSRSVVAEQRHQPFAQLPEPTASAAARAQPGNSAPDAVQSLSRLPGAAQEASTSQAVAQDEGLVASYSSFGYDAVPSYTWPGANSAQTYASSGNTLDPYDTGGESAAVITAHTHNDAVDFDEMTELQL